MKQYFFIHQNYIECLSKQKAAEDATGINGYQGIYEVKNGL